MTKTAARDIIDTRARPGSRRFLPGVLIVAAFALVRGLLILREFLAENPLAQTPISDAGTYWRWAEAIAGGQIVGDTPFLSAPLYPYLLGAIRAAGGGLGFVYGLQLGLYVLTALVLACAGRRQFGAAAGLAGAVVFVLLAEPTFAATRVLATTVQLFVLAVLWWQLIRLKDRPGPLAAVIAGLLLGVMCLANPPMMLAVPLLAAWALLLANIWPARLRLAGALAVGAGAVISVAVWHNWQATAPQREIIPISAHAGITFRQGNLYPDSTGTYTEVPGVSAAREQMHGDAMRVYQESTGDPTPSWGRIDSFFRGQGFRDWKDHPGWAVRLALRKLWYFLTARNYSDIYQLRAERERGLATWMWLAPVPTPWLMGPALVAAILMLPKLKEHGPALVLLAVPLIVVVAFWYSPRYRVPAVPLLAVLTGWALVRAASRARPSETTATIVALLATVAGGFVNSAIGFDPYEGREARLGLQIGMAYREQKQYDDAIAAYESVIRDQPGHGQAIHDLGGVYEEMGDLDRAIEQYLGALDVMPDSPVVQSSLASALIENDRVEQMQALLSERPALTAAFADAFYELARDAAERNDSFAAIANYREAIRINPDFAEAHNNLGSLLARQGRVNEALRHFRETVRLQPESPRAHYNLALALGQLNRFDEAADELREVLRLDPNHAGARQRLDQLGGRGGG